LKIDICTKTNKNSSYLGVFFESVCCRLDFFTPVTRSFFLAVPLQDEPTAAELMDGSFQRVANLSASLREGLDGMASSVAEGLDALPAARRDQRAAAAVVAAAAERASDGLIDVRLLSRQEETVPGFQAALAMLADFTSDQAELDTQVRLIYGIYS
jgi:3-oxoacyl-ACP reductase-like protein